MSGASLAVELTNRVSELQRLENALQTFAADHHLPDDVVNALRLALEEVVVNVIHHGYDAEGAHAIRVRFELTEHQCTVVVEDDARPYDPLSRPAPDLEADIEDRPIGGLGIFLVRELMDVVEYRREREQNILVMKKNWT